MHYTKAFTMAEVLITLGVIGIVVAMTIPQLVKNYQLHVLQNQLKAVYSDLNRASQLFKLHNDFSVSEYAYLNGSDKALELFKKEFKTIKKDNAKWDNVNENGRVYPYKLYSLSGVGNTWICDSAGPFFDMQGRVFSFDDAPDMNENGPKVCVDINGVKNPNKYGIDNFIFMFTVDGQVIPFGMEHKNNPSSEGNLYNNTYIDNPSDYCKYNVNSVYQVVACAYFALSDTHPEGNGKSYWRDFIGKVK